jgi:hypothetical protein
MWVHKCKLYVCVYLNYGLNSLQQNPIFIYSSTYNLPILTFYNNSQSPHLVQTQPVDVRWQVLPGTQGSGGNPT